jgi:dynactin complex subunit
MQEEPIPPSVQKEPVSVEEVKMTQEPEQVIIQNSNHLKPELNDSQISNSTSETSLLSNDNIERDKLPDWVKENAHVIVKTTTVQNQPGYIRFIGETKFSKGMWVGVELERTRGLNDGSYKGHRYFQCDPEKGVFVRADKLTLFKQQIN